MGRPGWLLLLLFGAIPVSVEEKPVDFRREVAPIIVENCLACHGPKKAYAHYRVDTYARLMAESDAGKNIEPGKPDDSLFLELIVQTEPTGRMPRNADPLTEAEIAVLRRWIEQGAGNGGVDPSAELAKLVGRADRLVPAGNPATAASSPKSLDPGIARPQFHQRRSR